MPYDPLWVGQLAGLRGRTVEPAAGPRGTRCMKGSIPLGGSPRLLSVARALLPKRVFFSSREEGASLSKAHLGLFHIALYIRWDGVNGADPA